MDIFLTTISSTGLIGVLLFLSRSLIETRLTNAVKHEYDEKLENIRAKLKADNDALASELAYISDAKLQRNAEARKIKQDYYHMFLEAISIKISTPNPNSKEFELANQKYCLEFNRLPLYASQEVVEFFSASAGAPPEFTQMYEVIRQDLYSDNFENFENLSSFNFQMPTVNNSSPRTTSI